MPPRTGRNHSNDATAVQRSPPRKEKIRKGDKTPSHSQGKCLHWDDEAVNGEQSDNGKIGDPPSDESNIWSPSVRDRDIECGFKAIDGLLVDHATIGSVNFKLQHLWRRRRCRQEPPPLLPPPTSPQRHRCDSGEVTSVRIQTQPTTRPSTRPTATTATNQVWWAGAATRQEEGAMAWTQSLRRRLN